jgi:hypothetical protein
MVKHIVLWTLKESAGGKSAHENALEMKARLEALRGCVPGLLELEVGIDFSRTEMSADVALYSEFTDREALAAYAIHPGHVEAAGFANACRVQRMIADYEV